MADKQSLGKKWGSLKRAARGSVKNLGTATSPLKSTNNKNFEQFDDEDDVVDDEFAEVQRSPADMKKITTVCSLIEHFRLQCPQTHAGLVVAFTSTTLSPLNDPGIKFKWYRMGGGENNDQFKQIDESPRAWYPPSADDIGKKICANCEDNFDQGYCRYAEAGPVEADPLLISMVESALENGRHEAKDVSFSLGVKSIDPCDPETSNEHNAHSFDMSSPQRPTSLLSTDAMTYPFLQFPNNIGLEVNYQGIFVNTTAASGTAPSTRRGMNILPSADLEMFCTLPASFVIVVPLPPSLREMLQKKSSRRNNKNSFSDSDESEDSEGECENTSTTEGKKEKEEQVDTTEDLLGLGAAPALSTDKVATSLSTVASGFEWIGYSSIDDAANGTGSELCMLLDSFLTTLPGGTTHVRLCFSFSDRMSRDAFALSCRVLAGIKPGAGYRDRLRSLPWFSEDGERRAVDVQSIGGNDLARRLKELEDENSSLKRAQSELHLQLMEQTESSSQMSHSSPSVASASVDSDELKANAQIIKDLRAKLRAGEKDLTDFKHKEMDWEKTSLEMEGRIKRIQADGVTHTNVISELHQRISESQAEAGAMRVMSEKYQAEMETIKAQLEVEVSDNRSKLQGDLSDLQKKVEKSSKALKEAEDALAAERVQLEATKRVVQERDNTINELRGEMVKAEAAAAEARTQREQYDELLAVSEAKIDAMVAERDAVLASLGKRDAEVEELQAALVLKEEDIAKLEAEKLTLLSDSVSPEEFLAMEETATRLQGEKNHLDKMTKSLQKDMKKVVKELQHQIWLAQEDLARSNERCEELRGVMTQMADDELKRLEEEEQNKSKSGIMGKMKSMRRQTSGAS